MIPSEILRMSVGNLLTTERVLRLQISKFVGSGGWSTVFGSAAVHFSLCKRNCVSRYCSNWQDFVLSSSLMPTVYISQ